MAKIPRIFISSTFVDLKDYRKIAIEAVNALGMHQSAMENFGARDSDPQTACLDAIEGCDAYIGIVAWRYGFIPGGQTLSITEMEYEHAIKCKIPRVLFILNDECPWNPKFIDRDRSDIDRLRERWKTDRVVEFFTNPESLSSAIKSSIATGLGLTVHTQEHTTKMLKVAIAKFVDTHHEASAFDVASDRAISSFYVNLGIKPEKGVLQQICHGNKAICFNQSEFLWTIESAACELLLAAFLSLPFNSKTDTLFDIACPTDELGIFKQYNWSDPRVFVHMRMDDRKVPSSVYVLRIYLDDMLARANSYLSQLHLQSTRESNCEAFQCIVDTNSFLHALIELIGTDRYAFKSLSADGIIQPEVLEFQQLDPSHLAAIKRNFCIYGEAGAGKTTTARAIVRAAIANGEKAIYFPCAKMSRNTESLRENIIEFMSEISKCQDRDAIEAYVDSVAILVIDGCDEAETVGPDLLAQIRGVAYCSRELPLSEEYHIDIPPQFREKIAYARKTKRLTFAEPLTVLDQCRFSSTNNQSLVEIIDSLVKEVKKTSPTVVLTMRQSAQMDIPDDFASVVLHPLDNEQLEMFLHRWFEKDKQKCDQLLQFLEQNTWLKEICRTPIVATIVATLQQNGIDLPRSKTEVYEKRFDLMLARWDAAKGIKRAKFHYKDKVHILSQLAYDMHVKKRRSFCIIDIQEVWGRGVAEVYPKLTVEDLLHELVAVDNVVYRESKADYSLGHLSFQEYLTANCLVCSHREAKLTGLIRDPWWHNVLLFFSGLTRDASSIIEGVQSIVVPVRGIKKLIRDVEKEARFTQKSQIQLAQDISEDIVDISCEWDEEEFDLGDDDWD